MGGCSGKVEKRMGLDCPVLQLSAEELESAEDAVTPVVQRVTEESSQLRTAIDYHNETLHRDYSQFTPNPNG
jgi:hypothetical protein